MLSDAEIKQLVREHLDNQLQWLDRVRLGNRGITPASIKAHKEGFQVNREAFKEALATNDLEFAKPYINGLIIEKGLNLNPRAADYKKLCRELLKAQVVILNTEMERMNGNYDNEYDKFLATSLEQKNSGKLLSAVVKDFIEMKIEKGTWTDKNKAEMVAFYNQFVEIMGDRDIATYDAPDFTRYISILKKFPWNVTKMKGVRNKPLQEIIQLMSDNKVTWKTIGETTIRKNIVRVNSLFSYALRKHYIDVNHVEEFKQKRKSKKEKKRLPYSNEDLKRWFNSPVYSEYSAEKIHKHPERFWVPLIMLFSGCRTGEVCQLHKQDFVVEDGIVCFYVTEEIGNDKSDKKVKTEYSIRKVPVHPFLKKIGLLKYKDSVEDMLFIKLKKGRDGYGYLFNKWAGRYNRKHISQDPKKVPYSFRHSFTDCLKQKSVLKELIEEITGHIIEGITFPVYSEDYNVKMRYEAIKKAKYDVDLSHIKYPFENNKGK